MAKREKRKKEYATRAVCRDLAYAIMFNVVGLAWLLAALLICCRAVLRIFTLLATFHYYLA